MEHLIEARQEFEGFVRTHPKDGERHGAIIGKAIAVCLAANDAEMAKYADCENKVNSLTPSMPYKGKNGEEQDWDSRNREGLQEAVKRLAKMIELA